MNQFLLRAYHLWRANPRLFYRRLGLFARRPLQSLAVVRATQRRNAGVDRAYRDWLDGEAALPAPALPTGADAPLLSVIMPVHDPPEAVLDEALASVLAQSYPHWECCIADDASTAPHVRAVLERYAALDPRVRVVYRPQAGHIAEASNSALALARGEFVVLLDHDDRLAPGALGAIAEAVADEPLVDLLYSDEDKLDGTGRRVTPFFKPVWSPALLLSCNYVTHLAAARRGLVAEVGGFRTETVGSQDHDLFLRLGERARAVAHIPRILYSWRMVAGSTAAASSAKPYTVAAARRALEGAIARRGLEATLEPSHLNGLFVLRQRPPEQARVSLIVRGAGDAWRACLHLPGITVCDFAALPGADGAQPARRPGDPPLVPAIDDLTGDYLVWLEAGERPARAALPGLLAQLRHEQVGLVGGVTVRRGIVLQSGLIIDAGGQPRYAFAGLPDLPQRNFYLNLKDLAREVSAVSLGGCAMRRATWQALGGWRAEFPPALALADLCLRAAEQEARAILLSPLARFTRPGPLPPLPAVAGYAWPWRGYADPFWNPNLAPGRSDGLPFCQPELPRARVRYRGPRGAFVASPPSHDRGRG